MKKILAMAIGMAAVACIASAESATYSQNAVGFIAFSDVKAHDLICMTIPFVHVGSSTAGDEELDISELQFTTDAPEFSVIHTWDTSIMQWVPNYKLDAGAGEVWPWDGEPLRAGQAIFFQPEEDMPSVVMAGQVPKDATCPVSIAPGLDVIGNPYPVPLRLSKSSLGTNAAAFTQFHKWEKDGQFWNPIGLKESDAGEGFDDDTVEFGPGEGFFFDTRDADAPLTQWEAEKGYTWP